MLSHPRLLLQAWGATTLSCLRTLEGHEDNVRVLAVGHGHLFSGSWDKTVRVRLLCGWACGWADGGQLGSKWVGAVCSWMHAAAETRMNAAARVSLTALRAAYPHL